MPFKKKIGVRSARKRAAPKAETQKKRLVPQPESFGFDIALLRVAPAKGGFRIKAGCRNFSPREAKTHWQERSRYRMTSRLCAPGCLECARGSAAIRTRADNMLKLLPLLAQRAKRYGWLKAAK